MAPLVQTVDNALPSFIQGFIGSNMPWVYDPTVFAADLIDFNKSNAPNCIKWVSKMPLRYVQWVCCADRRTAVACPVKIVKGVLALSAKNPVQSLMYCVRVIELDKKRYVPLNSWMVDLVEKYLNTTYLKLCYERARQFYLTANISFLKSNSGVIKHPAPSRKRPFPNSRIAVFLPDDKDSISTLYNAVLETQFGDGQNKKRLSADTVNLNLTVWCLMLFSDDLGRRVCECRSIFLTSVVATPADIAHLFGVSIDAKHPPKDCHDQVWYHITVIVSTLAKVKHAYGGKLPRNADLFLKFMKNTSSLLLFQLIKQRLMRIENYSDFIRRNKKNYLDVFTVFVEYFAEFGNSDGSLEESLMDTCARRMMWAGLHIQHIIIRFSREYKDSNVWKLKEINKQLVQFTEDWAMLRQQHGKLFPYGMVLKLYRFESMSIANCPDLAFAATSMYQNTIYKSRKIRNILKNMGMKENPTVIMKCL